MSCSGCTARGTVVYENDELQVKDGCNKLDTYDWLKDLPNTPNNGKILEVRFKNTHKNFYVNPNEILFKRGDVVAVEAQHGHDIGIVSLTGNLAEKQYKLRSVKSVNELGKIYRRATSNDIAKWQRSQERDKPTLLQSRKIIQDLGLDMKLSDVEYQGDGSKAIFYYIADGRVDFRKLIKVLAETFHIRVEMKQIGSRQEAALVGGIGSCGRELCCSTWKTNFTSIPTSAAKYQELSSNAQKLAGQCGKLKCCLMYELDTYLEAWEQFPKELLELETAKGTYYPFKVDVLQKKVYYSSKPDGAMDLTAINTERIKEIIQMNKKNEKPDTLKVINVAKNTSDFNFTSTDENDRIDRFQNKKNSRTKKKSRYKKRKIRRES